MNNTMATHKNLRIMFFIAITLVSVIAISSVWARFSGTQQDEASDRAAVVQALRRGGLRAAAKLKRHYVSEFDAHWDFSRLGVELLTKNSSVVIVGVVTKSLGGRLTFDGELILTDYEVTVDEAIKGNALLGGTIIVSLVGGRVEFEDGTSAELTTPKFEHMKPGRSYTFFLSESVTSPGGYTLAGGPQGLVEIDDTGKVKSRGRPTDPIYQESKDKDKRAFLEEVRKQARNWPSPGKCCD